MSKVVFSGLLRKEGQGLALSCALFGVAFACPDRRGDREV